MFYEASVFNQDLSDWDVSKGEIFVSDDQALQLFNILFSGLALFPRWMPSHSITAVWL
jgi:hypothetical protein